MVRLIPLALLVFIIGISFVSAQDRKTGSLDTEAIANDAMRAERLVQADPIFSSQVEAVSDEENPGSLEDKGASLTPVPDPVMDLQMSAEGNVSLDFRDAEIRNVLKVLAYKSGMNIIAGPEVVGLVNIQLKDVPWKKALEVILSTYGYSFEQKGTIIMVTTVENLKRRREDAKLLSDQEPVSNETFFLNFAKAEDVLKALDKMKTVRGSVNFDARTNALIVSDIESNLVLMRDVIKRLDAITPQVLIESKIIETTLDDTENMGIDWTVKATATGPSRSHTFPWKEGQDNRYLPATTFAADEFSYGTLNLAQFQAVLNMLKTRTKTNIVSNPRIVTLDNQLAKITVGSQYPIPQYTYNEEQGKLQVSGWNYLDIGVIFNVTPRVNNAGLVTLDIQPTVTDILRTVTFENTEVPVLSSETAKTTVMIRDGETLVIAGLIKDKKTKTNRKVPFLADIPFVGLAFQSKSDTVVKTEMLIFLTPHIITPEMATTSKSSPVEVTTGK